MTPMPPGAQQRLAQWAKDNPEKAKELTEALDKVLARTRAVEVSPGVYRVTGDLFMGPEKPRKGRRRK